MASSFASKAIVVTGGSSGIGLSTALKLIELGATVHVVDLAPSPPPELVKAGGTKRVHYYGSVDVSSRTSVHETFDKIFQVSPEIYGLVNSAGICPSSGIRVESDDVFQKIIGVNLGGTWNCATELLRRIEAAGTPADAANGASSSSPEASNRASIVLIGSSASLKGFPTLGAYCASKHAVLGLTRAWAEDFAPFGVRVNLVAPGGTDTPMTRGVLSRAREFAPDGGKSLENHAVALVPMKRQGRPEEIANGILFLLGDQASFITGQVLPVNGGYP